MAKRKKTNYDLQNIAQKAKDRATWTPLKPGVTQVFQKGKQFLLHMWRPSCYSSYKPSDKSWMGKLQGSAYDKWNIYVVICDTKNHVTVNQAMVAIVKLSK